MPLVSVIIPVHNAGAYLEPCLESVLHQTHRDLQVICVDDGSSDESAEVLRQHAGADSRLETTSQPKAGPGSARNAGLQRAAGDYLLFVDADDLLPPAAVETHLTALRGSTSDFSTGRVLRLTSTQRWPSAMHENALSRLLSTTHLYRTPSLLFDTTSWNKLFRRDYWTSHEYAYPDHVFFEDVALMTETHCRASTVEVVGEVVYWWRRRDDGILSITMRREDPALLRDRIAALERVRGLLRDLSPPAVRRAADTKFLRHDLGSYLQELEDTSPDFQREFVRLVGAFVVDTPNRVIDRLPPHLRVAYQLASRGRTAELVEFLGFLREHDWRLPVRRRWPAVQADLGPARAVVPRKYGSGLRRMPLRLGVTSVVWHGDTLLIEGFGFIDGVPLGHPMGALRRLQLIDSASGQVRHVWLAPRRLSPKGPVHQGLGGLWTSPSYEWSGFRAEVPSALLEPAPGRHSARWQVNLQVLARGAASGSSLGPLPGSLIEGLHRDRSGLVVAASSPGGARLLIETVRAPIVLGSVSRVGDLLRLSLRPSNRQAVRPVRVRLSPVTGPAVEVPSEPAAGGVGELQTLVDPLVLPPCRSAADQLSFGVSAVTEDGRAAPVTMVPEDELALAFGTQNVVVTPNAQGLAQVVLAGPRVMITHLSWSGLHLEIVVQAMPPEMADAELAWFNGAGEEIHPLSRSADGISATFDLLRVPGPEGAHPPRGGEWTLMTRQLDETWEPVVVPRSRGMWSERELGDDLGRVRIGVNAQAHLVMFVEAMSALDHSPFGQDRLQRESYRRARRSSVTDAILLEAWGGKTFSDNPRALLEAVSPVWQGASVVVAVADRSIATPSGVRAVVAGSRDHHDHRARARLIISNDSLPTHYVKRPGQRYLQTWHGTPLKRIGLDIERIRFRNKNYRQDLRSESAKWDWLISPNAYSTEVFRRAFAYEGPILETGYPRNDLLAGGDEARRVARRQHVRRWLGIEPDRQVVLWAPTWRDDSYSPEVGYTPTMFLEQAALGSIVPPDCIVLFHGHHLFGSRGPLGRSDRVRDVSGYPDVRDLMLASDALVTDYSSILFDYALTGRPIVCYAPDLLHYQQIRGLYLDLEQISPGPVVSTIDELAESLRSLSVVRTEFAAAREAFRQRFGALEDGGAAGRVWTAVAEAI